MTYENILVAVDRTRDADAVLNAAQQLSSDTSKIHLLTVVELLSNVYGDMVWAPLASRSPQLDESIMTQALKHLTALASRHNVDPANVHVVAGASAPQIRHMAGELGAQLIVIGSHARRGLGLLLGSTANSVLHGVNVDVLVVRLRDAG